MNKTKFMLNVLGTAVFILSSAFIAEGQNNRTFVSGTGSDGNTGTGCQQNAPCRTFASAIGVTNAGGQVIALDSTGYSAFSINKSITIEGAPGQTAFIFVGAGGTGVTVTGAASDLIILRNLFIDGLNVGTNIGLQHNSGKLVVENCTFRSLTTGVSVFHARMDLVNSTLYSNTTAVSSDGAGASTPGNGSTVSVAMIRINGGNITNNGTGLLQKNPGIDPTNSTFLANIWVFTLTPTPSVGNLNVIANTANTACSGATNCIFPLYRMGDNFQ
ncbi:MAG TPA: hypothetical protein VEM96_05365 [Pyrinomonadaceae bacterium]|nr:hypothetical protein [Pyrinomonadaceae bacterium]